MFSLRELQHGPTKSECIQFINSRKWFDIQLEDKKPYASGNTEPRWQTLIAWGRKNCVDSGYIENEVRDSWQPTKNGLNAVVMMCKAFEEKRADVRRCYLFTTKFKQLIDPAYSPSDNDKKRPEYLYEDCLPEYRKSVRGSKQDRINKMIHDLLSDEL
ncbi:hypothetical protein [Rubritalea tangerina]